LPEFKRQRQQSFENSFLKYWHGENPFLLSLNDINTNRLPQSNQLTVALSVGTSLSGFCAILIL
jgi:hypothetical protein